MKTIKQWLKDRLSEGDYKIAEKYRNKDWEERTYTFGSALYFAFDWDKTKEGDDYWRDIYKNGGSLQTDQMRATEQITSNQNPYKHPTGLTKREYFAGLAMQGLINNVNSDQYIAESAVRLADELLKQLDL